MVDRPFRTAAAHYWARAPYSADLLPALSEHLGWNGSGRLLDVGSGPGVIALALAPAFAEVVALDPEPQMLAEGKTASTYPHVRWVEGRAEDIPDFGLGLFDAITFAQSLHRTDRDLTLGIVHRALSTGGSVLLIGHELRGFGMPERSGFSARQVKGPPGVPPLPYEVVWEAIERYLGFVPSNPADDEERYATVLRRSVFGNCEELILPGRTDIIRTPENVVDMFLSTSFAAPERFGASLEEFRSEVVEELRAMTETGTFWEWLGDTEVIVGRRI